MKNAALRNGMVFVSLVAFGVLGRWLQPAWNLTPLAAIGLFAGYYFRDRWLAIGTPLLTLFISNLILPSYSGPGVMASIYLAATIPAFLGRNFRQRVSMPAAIGGVLAPSVLFFVITNFAVWYFPSWYAATPAGLFACYTAAVPFFRNMLCGDVLYSGLLFGVCATARASMWHQLKPATVTTLKVSR